MAAAVAVAVAAAAVAAAAAAVTALQEQEQEQEQGLPLQALVQIAPLLARHEQQQPERAYRLRPSLLRSAVVAAQLPAPVLALSAGLALAGCGQYPGCPSGMQAASE